MLILLFVPMIFSNYPAMPPAPPVDYRDVHVLTKDSRFILESVAAWDNLFCAPQLGYPCKVVGSLNPTRYIVSSLLKEQGTPMQVFDVLMYIPDFFDGIPLMVFAFGEGCYDWGSIHAYCIDYNEDRTEFEVWQHPVAPLMGAILVDLEPPGGRKIGPAPWEGQETMVGIIERTD